MPWLPPPSSPPLPVQYRPSIYFYLPFIPAALPRYASVCLCPVSPFCQSVCVDLPSTSRARHAPISPLRRISLPLPSTPPQPHHYCFLYVVCIAAPRIRIRIRVRPLIQIHGTVPYRTVLYCVVCDVAALLSRLPTPIRPYVRQYWM